MIGDFPADPFPKEPAREVQAMAAENPSPEPEKSEGNSQEFPAHLRQVETVPCPSCGAELVRGEFEAAGCGECGARSSAAGIRKPFSRPAGSILSLNGAVQLAAASLPAGFQIHVHVERGAGWVSLDYPGVAFEYSPDGADKTLSEQILECVEKAKATPVVKR
jgi:hypothetical protein